MSIKALDTWKLILERTKCKIRKAFFARLLGRIRALSAAGMTLDTDIGFGRIDLSALEVEPIGTGLALAVQSEEGLADVALFKIDGVRRGVELTL